MEPLIEYCEQNLAKGTELLLSDNEISENSDTVTYSCMNECALCAQTYFALFEGERLPGETPEILREKIKIAISDWKEEMG